MSDIVERLRAPGYNALMDEAASEIAVLRGKLTQAEAERQVLDGIGEALESRGYVHMTNGRDIGLLLDELAQARISVEGVAEARKRIDERLADLREANEIFRKSSWDRSADIQRNDREIRWMIDARTILAFTSTEQTHG